MKSMMENRRRPRNIIRDNCHRDRLASIESLKRFVRSHNLGAVDTEDVADLPVDFADGHGRNLKVVAEIVLGDLMIWFNHASCNVDAGYVKGLRIDSTPFELFGSQHLLTVAQGFRSNFDRELERSAHLVDLNLVTI